MLSSQWMQRRWCDLQRRRCISSFEVSRQRARVLYKQQGIKQDNHFVILLDRASSDSHSESACVDTRVLSQNRRLYAFSKLNTVDQLALAEAAACSFGTAADPFVFVWSSPPCRVPYVERCCGGVAVPAAVSLRLPWFSVRACSRADPMGKRLQSAGCCSCLAPE